MVFKVMGKIFECGINPSHGIPHLGDLGQVYYPLWASQNGKCKYALSHTKPDFLSSDPW